MNTEKIHPRAAFLHRDFRFYLSARFLALVSHQMLNVAVGQWVWERTHNPLYLGYIGLALFIPKIAFTLFAGHAADRYDRRNVILVCRILQLVATLGLILITRQNWVTLSGLYGLLFFMGTANAFDGPASQSIVPQLVPTHHFTNAVKWNSSTFQMAFILGPALGGWIYGLSGPLTVYGVIALMRLGSVLFVGRMQKRPRNADPEIISWKNLMAGIHYVLKTRIILGPISLDLFAVLLGGVLALLPIYANEILKVGVSGLGMLRAAPAFGAALVAIAMAYLPPLKKAGPTLLYCVGIFGVSTLLFGISKNFIFSLACLFVLGAADMISVVIRGVIVQMKTPDSMRGRVSAVNLIFIGASNELGEFESGLTASWFGTIPAVVIGGAGTLVVTLVWAWLFPEIRKLKQLEEPIHLKA